MDRGVDRVWVWVCDPSLMFLAVAIYLESQFVPWKMGTLVPGSWPTS